MGKLEQIATFIEVVEKNSFKAAAQQAGISTAAISRQIAALESELNIQLINRTTRHLTLTELGAQYYSQCKKILHALDETEQLIAHGQQEATGVLNIMATRYFALTHIIPRLPLFLADNPKLQIKLSVGERFPHLSDEGIDLLYGVSLSGSPDLIQRRIADTRYVLCASPAYLKTHGTPLHFAELAQHQYITHITRPKPNIIYFHHKEITVQPTLWLNDAVAMRECAIQGLGLVYLHDYEVADALEQGLLVEVLKKHQAPAVPVYLYYQQNKFLLPKIRRFIDFYMTPDK